MTDAVCPACGAPLWPGAPTCERCGRPVGAPGPDGLLWAAIAVVVVGVLIAGGILVWALRSGDGGTGEAFVATGQTSSTSTTSTTTTTAPPTTVPAPAPLPPASPPAAPFDWTTAAGSPFEAVADWAVGLGLNYAGLCDQLDSTANLGPDPWCASVAADRGPEVVFRLADFPGGDFGVWVLTAATPDGWQVVDDAEDTGGGPPF